MKIDSRSQILATLPATQTQIRKATGLAQATISRYLILLREDNDAHIGAWADVRRGFMSAVYHAGPGVDVPCPKPLSEAELARRQAMRDSPLKLRNIVPKFEKPRRCELTAAFFGAPA